MYIGTYVHSYVCTTIRTYIHTYVITWKICMYLHISYIHEYGYSDIPCLFIFIQDLTCPLCMHEPFVSKGCPLQRHFPRDSRMHLAIPRPLPRQLPNTLGHAKATPQAKSQRHWLSQGGFPNSCQMQAATRGHSPKDFPMHLVIVRPFPEQLPNATGHPRGISHTVS